jgi:hypothetical protein
MSTGSASAVTAASTASLAGLTAARPRSNTPRTAGELFHRECSRSTSLPGRPGAIITVVPWRREDDHGFMSRAAGAN